MRTFTAFSINIEKNKSLIKGINCMKKLISLLGVLLCFVFIFTACSKNLTEKSDIISLYQNNEETFLQAANSGDYSTVENIRGVQSVYISEKYVKISCGCAGFGPSTHYYGIFYSADGDMCAIDVAGPEDELVESGDGYLYQESGGDNRYYVEALVNNFYYYEADF